MKKILKKVCALVFSLLLSVNMFSLRAVKPGKSVQKCGGDIQELTGDKAEELDDSTQELSSDEKEESDDSTQELSGEKAEKSDDSTQELSSDEKEESDDSTQELSSDEKEESDDSTQELSGEKAEKSDDSTQELDFETCHTVVEQPTIPDYKTTIKMYNDDDPCGDFDSKRAEFEAFRGMVFLEATKDTGDSSVKLPRFWKEACDVLARDPAVLNLRRDTIVVGDIHADLDSLNKVINLFLQYNGDKNILFLGDYADRGRDPDKCFSLLFKLKTLFPNRVFLLRGNHESASYPDFYVSDVCDINPRFERLIGNLPIAAVVCKKRANTFCIHGGFAPKMIECKDLSCFVKCDSELKYINYSFLQPKIYDDVEGNVGNALWSEPDYSLAGTTDHSNCDFNVRRNAGYCFSKGALRKFLENKGLTRLFRGHSHLNMAIWPSGKSTATSLNNSLCTTINSTRATVWPDKSYSVHVVIITDANDIDVDLLK